MAKEVKFRLPTSSDKGFFKFLRCQSRFFEVLAAPAGHSIAEIDEAMEWLVSLVDEPKDRKKAREYIENLSMDDILEVLRSFKAKDADPNS
jgi:hypothetical protein